MKKIASILLLGATLCSCSGSADDSYEITGEYPDTLLNRHTLFLLDGDSIVDSTKVQGATFKFMGATDSILIARVANKSFYGNRIDFTTVANVILQPGTKAAIKVGDNITVDDNGGVNSIWSNYNIQYRAIVEKDMDIYNQMIEKKVPQDSLKKFVTEKRAKMDAIRLNAVQKNRENLAGAAIFASFCKYISKPEEFASFVENLKYAHIFPQIVAMQKVFDNLNNTAEGKKFVDFEGTDLTGKNTKLSDYVGKGKYVLVDFWASWCGPCRREIPNLIQVNKKYESDNFMVLGVNVWDQEDNFKKSLNEEKVNYSQIFTGTSREATKLYGIKGIPQIILFGPDGTILKRNLRGEAIENTVKEFLKK